MKSSLEKRIKEKPDPIDHTSEIHRVKNKFETYKVPHEFNPPIVHNNGSQCF